MKWKYFYDNFWNWSNNKILRAIPTLSDIEHLDFLYVAMNLKTTEAKAALTKRAIRLNGYFSHDDFLYLSTVLERKALVALADYAGFCAEYPNFKPTRCSWEEFMEASRFLGERALTDAIYNVKHFGTSEDVMKMSFTIKDSDIRQALYDEAFKRGVVFSKEEQQQIKGYALKHKKPDIFTEIAQQANQAADRIDRLTKKIKVLKKTGTGSTSRQPSFSFLDFMGMFSESNNKGRHAHSGKCNGDCANCPPHYGYRHGRWYYGHSHTEGCEFGGNSCSGGRD